METQRVKVPGAQPKYSPDNGPEELPAINNSEYDDMLFDDYVSDVREPEVTLPSAALNLSQPSNGGGEWTERVPEPEAAQPTAAPVNQRWIPATPSIPSYTIRNDVPEREVFEL